MPTNPPQQPPPSPNDSDQSDDSKNASWNPPQQPPVPDNASLSNDSKAPQDLPLAGADDVSSGVDKEKTDNEESSDSPQFAPVPEDELTDVSSSDISASEDDLQLPSKKAVSPIPFTSTDEEPSPNKEDLTDQSSASEDAPRDTPSADVSQRPQKQALDLSDTGASAHEGESAESLSQRELTGDGNNPPSLSADISASPAEPVANLSESEDAVVQEDAINKDISAQPLPSNNGVATSDDTPVPSTDLSQSLIEPEKPVADLSEPEEVTGNDELAEKPPLPLRKPGGEDAPDPFVQKAPETSAPTPEIAPGNYSADVIHAEKPPTVASETSDTPLAPPAFSQPVETGSGGNRKRFVILLFGSILLFLLLGALGVIMARVLFFNDDENGVIAPTVTPISVAKPTSTSIFEDSNTVDPSLVTINLGPWTTPPPCLDYEDPDVLDNDDDNDGLTTREERHYSTDPCNADTDRNGFTDGESVRAGYDPLTGGMLDSDGDGIPDPVEIDLGADPYDPDTDSDGYSDCLELINGYDPRIASPDDKMVESDRAADEEIYTGNDWTLPTECPDTGN